MDHDGVSAAGHQSQIGGTHTAMLKRDDLLAGRIVEVQHGIVAEAVAIAVAHKAEHQFFTRRTIVCVLVDACRGRN